MRECIFRYPKGEHTVEGAASTKAQRKHARVCARKDEDTCLAEAWRGKE